MKCTQIGVALMAMAMFAGVWSAVMTSEASVATTAEVVMRRGGSGGGGGGGRGSGGRFSGGGRGRGNGVTYPMIYHHGGHNSGGRNHVAAGALGVLAGLIFFLLLL